MNTAPWIFRIFTSLTLVTGALGLTGCGPRSPEPVTVPQDIPGYRGLREEFGPLDFTPLKGRRLVLDPGHGGFFRGAVGPGGLTEAEVNLGVALYLRGLLEWAGAEVHLTRTADYDFLSPADSSLAADLAHRINFANDLQPDAFISIHHNSTAAADPTINETQTYFPIDQEGASLDLARSIHRHLVLNLEISPAKILPGNFHVLRQAQMPAVLGEPAMISHPVMEGRLSMAASHDLEAKAYFLGLLDYFAGGSPTWSGAALDTLLCDQRGFPISQSWTFQTGNRPHDPGPDPGSFNLTQDGRPEPFQLSADGRTVTWSPAGPLPGHTVELALTGRNLKGRATPVRRTTVIPTDTRGCQVWVYRESGGKETPAYDLLRWWRSSGNEAGNEAPGPLTPGSGDGIALLRAAAVWTEAAIREALGAAPKDRTEPTGMADLAAPVRLKEISNPSGLSWRLVSLADGRPDLVTEAPPGGWRNRLATGEDWPPGNAGSPGLAVNPAQSVWLEARGALPLVDPAPATADTARTVAATARYWVSEKLVPAIFGATIVLDPAGGGPQTDGTGPLGTRGADINLETALQAKLLLEGAGATVFLTRTGEYAPPPQDKIRLAGRVGADLFLTICRSAQPGQITISHHPGSAAGQRWAQALAAGATSLQPADAPQVIDVGISWAYLLRHTACPALEAAMPPLSTPAREIQATSPAWPQAVARAILLSVAAVLGDDGVLANTLDIRNTLAKLPPERALPHPDWVQLDGNFSWLPAPSRVSSFQAKADYLPFMDPSPAEGPGLPALLRWHTLEIHQGPSWQLWLLDLSRVDLEPRLMMEGP